MPNIIEAARAWYARGFTPIALFGLNEDGTCACGLPPHSDDPKQDTCDKSRGKHPVKKDWQKTHKQLPQIERELQGVRNLGLRMGTQRDGRCLICIDVDDPLAFAKWEDLLGELPPTLTQRTGSGGQHFIFVWPGELEAPTTGTNGLPKGVDVRCERGQIVAAPSVHKSGGTYEVIHDIEPQPLPRRWAEALEPKDEPIAALPVPQVANPSQQLQDCLNYTARMAPSIQGSNGSRACFDVALKCVEFALSQQDAMHVMLVFNQRCQPPWSKRELEHKVKQAYTKGKAKPGTKGSMAREPLPAREQHERQRSRQDAQAPIPQKGPRGAQGHERAGTVVSQDGMRPDAGTPGHVPIDGGHGRSGEDSRAGEPPRAPVARDTKELDNAGRVDRRTEPEVLARAQAQVEPEQADAQPGSGRLPKSDASAAGTADTKRAAKSPPNQAVASNTKEPKREAAPTPDDGLDPEWCSPDIETWWLPKPIQDWVVATSECRQVPALMPTMAVLCTLAAICQGRSEVKFCAADPEPLSLYWFLFAGTGTRKSAVLKRAAKPLRDYLHKLKEECEPERRAAIRRRAQLEAEEKRLLRKNVSDWSPEGATRKNELAVIANELDTLKIPSVPMMLVSDINQQLLPRILKRNLEADGIAACAALDAEGTMAANMLGRSTGHVHVDTLLKASMGEPLELVRMSQVGDEPYEAILPHAHVTLGIMCQHHYIDRFREHPELSDTGFIGRCIFSSMPNIRKIQGDEQEVPERIERAYAACLHALCEADLPPLLDLRESAPWRLWRDTLPDLGAPGWQARVLGRIARIAGLCELVEGLKETSGGASQPELPLSELEGTVRLSDGRGTPKLSSRVNKTVEYLYEYFIQRDIKGIQILERPSVMRTAMARRVGGWFSDSLTVGSVLTVRDVQRKLTCSKAQALEACDELIEAGYLEQAGETKRGNRTVTITYRVAKLPPSTTKPKRKAPRWAIDDAGADPENDGR